MTHLPTVTVAAVTTKDHGKTIEAIFKTLNHIKPHEVLYFADVEYNHPFIKHIQIDGFSSVKDYNRFIVKELGKHVNTSHVLVIQHDGYVIDGNAWTDEFLDYDYIGAPWRYTDGRNVGNGGFSLRSNKLQMALATDPNIEMYSPEDEVICRFYRQYLEEKHGIKYAPEELAHKFSFEMHKPKHPTFGFHNYFHQTYRKPIVLKRSGAMGDVIMIEPVMEHLYNQGRRVVLDTPRSYYNLFAKHFYQIEHIDDLVYENMLDWEIVNLDMAYEVSPKELVLKSYYRNCGIENGVLRNPRLNFKAKYKGDDVKMFDKYVVIHTDDTAMSHRNVHGVDWEEVANYIQVFLGYPVFRVGRGNGTGGQKINTFSENMLGYIVGNANYFIGLDSGIGQIAVACQIPSMLFFGSVDADKRYPDLSNIKVMNKSCPANKSGCYHSVISTTGVDCEVNAISPPCITWKTSEVIENVKNFIAPSL